MEEGLILDPPKKKDKNAGNSYCAETHPFYGPQKRKGWGKRMYLAVKGGGRRVGVGITFSRPFC